MKLTNLEFNTAFQALTDYSPMRWQGRLYQQIMQSRLRRACELPTGLGKTSVIPIWLIALAAQAGNDSINLPRRLIYIVNRRTVVDQATDVVLQIRNRLLDPNNRSWQTHTHTLTRLANELRKLSAGLDDLPLAISTLRGELADNEEWKADPSRPAIIVGTIDMVGSKLLFSGYGDGRYHRPHHAGLIGQDSLIVHDEAHLTPAFSDLLCNVAEAQRHANERRPVQVLELSATTRGNKDDALTLEPEDQEDKIVQQRLDAKKNLRFHKIGNRDLAKKVAELAGKHDASPSRVLIHVRSPETAQEVLQALGEKLGRDSDSRTALLTGTIRGHERDRLVREDPVYRALLNHDQPVERTVYLVSTSAGEVGIDLDADHLVCDLTTLDSMIQRLGRVNRRGGEDRLAIVDVVVGESEANSKDKASEFERAMTVTQTILGRLPLKDDGMHDGSPSRIRELLISLDEDEKSKAFSPRPDVQPASDILFDCWSLTSIGKPMPGRPEIAPYLHGLTRDEPETYLAWRREVALLDKADADAETLRDWFHACRIEAHERLRDRTDRVKKTLQTLLEKHRRENKDCDFPVILLDERGDAERHRLSVIIGKEFSLAYRTVVLPVEAGGLTQHGILDGNITESASHLDVAETDRLKQREDRRERWLLTETEDGDQWEQLVTGETASSPPQDLHELERVMLQAAPESTEEEKGAQYLVLMVSPRRSTLENPEIALATQTVKQHTGYIEDYAKRIARALKLDSDMEEALVTAARWHDRGKARPVWQRFACNRNPAEPLAKSTKYLHGRALGGYRHEFGSLMQAAADDALQNHPKRDLILHLIAAHHGWARPHFETSALDNIYTTQENQHAAAEIMRRFGQLQQRFGRWGLAWLESLLRCADIAGSKHLAAASTQSRLEEV